MFSMIRAKKRICIQGRIQDFRKRKLICIKEWRFALLIYLDFLNILLKCNNLVSVRPNYLILMGYLKTGEGGGGDGCSSDPPPSTPMDPPLVFTTQQRMTYLLIKYPATSLSGCSHPALHCEKDVNFGLQLKTYNSSKSPGGYSDILIHT